MHAKRYGVVIPPDRTIIGASDFYGWNRVVTLGTIRGVGCFPMRDEYQIGSTLDDGKTTWGRRIDILVGYGGRFRDCDTEGRCIRCWMGLGFGTMGT